MQCEEKKGKYENIEELSMNNNFKYMCPFCRKEHESIMRQKHKSEKMKKNGGGFLGIKRKENKLPLNDVANIHQFNNKIKDFILAFSPDLMKIYLKKKQRNKK